MSDCRTPFSPSPVLQALAPLTVVGRLFSSRSTTLRLTGHVAWVCSAHSLCTAGFPRVPQTPDALGHKPLLCGCPANAGVLAAPLLYAGGTPHPAHHYVTTQNVSTQCLMSPGVGEGSKLSTGENRCPRRLGRFRVSLWKGWQFASSYCPCVLCRCTRRHTGSGCPTLRVSAHADHWLRRGWPVVAFICC